MAEQSPSSRQGGPKAVAMDNLTYDIVTLLHEKSKGLEAYSKYVQDAASNPEVLRLLEQLRDQDLQSVQGLKRCLAQLIGAEAAKPQSAGGVSGHPDDDVE